MKSLHAAAALVALSACTSGEAPKSAASAEPTPKTWQPREVSGPPGHGAASQPAAAAGVISGKVLETMDGGGYTYVQVDAGAKGQVWAAGPVTKVAVGDTVSFTEGMVMEAFPSKALNRTFDRIYFADALRVGGAGPAPAPAAPPPAAAPASAPATGAPHPTANVEVGPIEKPAGGLTVAEVFAQAAALSGKQVVLRGKVVKYNANIMGKNWLHLQDGSGAAGTNDLTVTTADPSAVGEVVLVKGTVSTNKDFGSGYAYGVLIEDASVSK
jgi:hypothetical protein